LPNELIITIEVMCGYYLVVVIELNDSLGLFVVMYYS